MDGTAKSCRCPPRPAHPAWSGCWIGRRRRIRPQAQAKASTLASLLACRQPARLPLPLFSCSFVRSLASGRVLSRSTADCICSSRSPFLKFSMLSPSTGRELPNPSLKTRQGIWRSPVSRLRACLVYTSNLDVYASPLASALSKKIDVEVVSNGRLDWLAPDAKSTSLPHR